MNVVLLPCNLLKVGNGTDISPESVSKELYRCSVCGRQFEGKSTDIAITVLTLEPAVTYKKREDTTGCPKAGSTASIVV